MLYALAFLAGIYLVPAALFASDCYFNREVMKAEYRCHAEDSRFGELGAAARFIAAFWLSPLSVFVRVLDEIR